MPETTPAQKILSPYGEWQRSEGVPIIEGLIVPDLHGDIHMEKWHRKGVKGAFLSMIGAEEAMDAYIVELPPGGNTDPEKFMFEENTFVVSGRGATTIWLPGGKKHTFEWQKGSVFTPPINSWRQHFNGSPDEPVRLLTMSNAPVMFNMMRSKDFIFNCEHSFTDRFGGEEDYFSGKGESFSGNVWRTNFIPDLYSFELLGYAERGAGGSGRMFEMASNTTKSHMAEFPVGTYKKAHRHGPGAHIVILTGHGFSLMWEEGKPKEKIDWGPGSLFVPPDMWFHQHFNSGTEPARYFAVHYGGWRVVIEELKGGNDSTLLGGHQIEYEDEDADVLETFVDELHKHGTEPKPIGGWRK